MRISVCFVSMRGQGWLSAVRTYLRPTLAIIRSLCSVCAGRVQRNAAQFVSRSFADSPTIFSFVLEEPGHTRGNRVKGNSSILYSMPWFHVAGQTLAVSFFSIAFSLSNRCFRMGVLFHHFSTIAYTSPAAIHCHRLLLLLVHQLLRPPQALPQRSDSYMPAPTAGFPVLLVFVCLHTIRLPKREHNYYARYPLLP